MLLKRFLDVFRDTPGKATRYECKIKLRDKIPVNQRPYPIPIVKLGAVEAKVDKRLEVIERFKSPYSSPIVPVFKKNVDVRLCLDARKIDEKNIPNRECPTTIETLSTQFNRVNS